jgi:aryl-alcohol dehydrogenase
MLKIEPIIVETTGNTRPNKEARFALSGKGMLSLLAISTYRESEMPPPVPGQTIFNSVAGDSNPQEFIPYLIKCYKKERFPFTDLITHYAPDQVNRAIQDSKNGKAIKPVINF